MVIGQRVMAQEETGKDAEDEEEKTQGKEELVKAGGANTRSWPEKLETEVAALKKQLREAQEVVSHMTTQMELQKRRTKQLVAAWKVRLEEGEEKLRRHKAKLDEQLQKLISDLLFFEGAMRREQKEISTTLVDKDSVISSQKRTIDSLMAANVALTKALKKLKRKYKESVRAEQEISSDRPSSWLIQKETDALISQIISEQHACQNQHFNDSKHLSVEKEADEPIHRESLQYWECQQLSTHLKAKREYDGLYETALTSSISTNDSSNSPRHLRVEANKGHDQNLDFQEINLVERDSPLITSREEPDVSERCSHQYAADGVNVPDIKLRESSISYDDVYVKDEEDSQGASSLVCMSEDLDVSVSNDPGQLTRSLDALDGQTFRSYDGRNRYSRLRYHLGDVGPSRSCPNLGLAAIAEETDQKSEKDATRGSNAVESLGESIRYETQREQTMHLELGKILDIQESSDEEKPDEMCDTEQIYVSKQALQLPRNTVSDSAKECSLTWPSNRVEKDRENGQITEKGDVNVSCSEGSLGLSGGVDIEDETKPCRENRLVSPLRRQDALHMDSFEDYPQIEQLDPNDETEPSVGSKWTNVKSPQRSHSSIAMKGVRTPRDVKNRQKAARSASDGSGRTRERERERERERQLTV